MTETLDTELRLSLSGLLRQTDELATLTDLAKLSFVAHLPSGTLAGQADKIWHDERTLAAGASDLLTLDALAMPALGGTLSIALVKVKLLLVVNTAVAAGNDLHVGGAGVALALQILGGTMPAAQTTLLTPVVWENVTPEGKAAIAAAADPAIDPTWPLGLEVPGWTTYTKDQLLACKAPGE